MDTSDEWIRQRTGIITRKRASKGLDAVDLADAFAGRDHTTVLHACRQIRTLMEADGKLREDWDKLIRKLSE